MDNLTHSLFALTLARTPLGRSGRGTTATLLLASNAPDIDIIATAGGAAKYLEWHRGPTHGVPGIIGLGVMTAAIVWMGCRWPRRQSVRPAPLLHLCGIAVIGTLCHVLMDLPTSYGTRLLSPVDTTWFAVDWLPIIDIYLIAILGAGLWFGRSAPSRNVAIAIALMGLNYGVRATAHHAAIVRAPELLGPQLPTPCEHTAPASSWLDTWPRADVDALHHQASGRCLIEIAALPDFISPFRWRLVADLSDGYEVRTVDLFDGWSGRPPPESQVRMMATRYPSRWTPAADAATRSDLAKVFLGFSRFPVVRALPNPDGSAVVRWSDIRFTTEGPRSRPRVGFFEAAVTIGVSGQVLEERLGR